MHSSARRGLFSLARGAGYDVSVCTLALCPRVATGVCLPAVTVHSQADPVYFRDQRSSKGNSVELRAFLGRSFAVPISEDPLRRFAYLRPDRYAHTHRIAE